jgi:limonene-1,2-epoxide hydrolase
MDPVVGRHAILAELTSFMAMGGDVSVEIVHLMADGPFVMTERIDHFAKWGRTISLPVMGLFDVQEGVIAAWRDYFDLAQFTAGVADLV